MKTDFLGRKWNFGKKKKKSWNLGQNKFGGNIFQSWKLKTDFRSKMKFQKKKKRVDIWGQFFFYFLSSKVGSWKLILGRKWNFRKRKSWNLGQNKFGGNIFVAENFLSSKVGSWKLILGQNEISEKKRKKSWNLGPKKFGAKIFWAENFLSIFFVNLKKLYSETNLCDIFQVPQNQQNLLSHDNVS